jgi:hypothetical protein
LLKVGCVENREEARLFSRFVQDVGDHPLADQVK